MVTVQYCNVEWCAVQYSGAQRSFWIGVKDGLSLARDLIWVACVSRLHGRCRKARFPRQKKMPNANGASILQRLPPFAQPVVILRPPIFLSSHILCKRLFTPSAAPCPTLFHLQYPCLVRKQHGLDSRKACRIACKAQLCPHHEPAYRPRSHRRPKPLHLMGYRLHSPIAPLRLKSRPRRPLVLFLQ